MNREFEFKQLLRAYRGGIISEAAFEQEMARLETGGAAETHSANGAGFRAFGRTYKSERAAVVSFIDKVCAGESQAGRGVSALGRGLQDRMYPQRPADRGRARGVHARVFEARMRDMGAELRASATEEGRKFTALLADPKRTDAEKLMQFVRRRRRSGRDCEVDPRFRRPAGRGPRNQRGAAPVRRGRVLDGQVGARGVRGAERRRAGCGGALVRAGEAGARELDPHGGAPHQGQGCALAIWRIFCQSGRTFNGRAMCYRSSYQERRYDRIRREIARGIHRISLWGDSCLDGMSFPQSSSAS